MFRLEFTSFLKFIVTDAESDIPPFKSSVILRLSAFHTFLAIKIKKEKKTISTQSK